MAKRKPSRPNRKNVAKDAVKTPRRSSRAAKASTPRTDHGTSVLVPAPAPNSSVLLAPVTRRLALATPYNVRARARNAYYLYREELKELRYVKAVSVGLRYRDGRPTGDIALRLHVDSEKDKALLKNAAIAGELNLRPLYGDLPIDIVAWTMKPCANGLGDGELLRCGGRRASLGTAVTVASSGGSEVMWLVAAHLISTTTVSPTLSSDVEVTDSAGNAIGAVPSMGGYIERNRLVDAALIRPYNRLAPIPLDRTAPEPETITIGQSVFMHGAEHTSIGEVDSVLHTTFRLETETGSTECIEKHFIVRGISGAFCGPGDSGAILVDNTNRKRVLGLVRAEVHNESGATGMAVVSYFQTISAELGFYV